MNDVVTTSSTWQHFYLFDKEKKIFIKQLNNYKMKIGTSLSRFMYV